MRRGFPSGLLWALLVFAGPLHAALPVEPAEDFELPPAEGEAVLAPQVAAIEIRSEAPLEDEQDLEGLFDFAVGDPLTDLKVRRTLRNVQASGRGTEVEIYTRPAAAGGVVAIVVLRAAVQVDSVTIVGELGLPKSDLYEAVPQRVAQPLSEEQVLAGVYNLEKLYEERGYFEAQVHLEVRPDPGHGRSAIVYHVTSGPQAVIEAIDFAGPIAPWKPQDLLPQLGIKVGAPYTHGSAERGVERLERWLISQHFNLAQIQSPKVEHLAGGRLHLTYPIDVGPRLEVQVVGADFDRLRKAGLLSFLGTEGYDAALLQQALVKIKDFYQREGYYHVQVEPEEKRGEGVFHLQLTVVPGTQYRLEDVRFEGNKGVSDRELANLMTVSQKKLLALGSGRLVESVLKQDLDNIGSYYASQGYVEARVGPQRVEESGDRLHLVIPIVEGRRELVGELKLEGIDALPKKFPGLEALPLDTLRARLSLHAGGPFHPALLNLTLDAIRQAYADRGFDTAQVSAASDWNPAHTRVDLTISVVEGPQAVVDRVIVRGNQHTRTDVIVRTVGLAKDQAVSRSRLLEAERALYRLGIFSLVKVDLTRAGLGVSGRDVVIRVEEGKPRTVSYGLGYDSEEGVRATIGYTHGNVAGRAYSLSTDLRFSERQDRIARILFDQPYFGRYPIPVTSSLFYIVTEDRQKGFTVTKWGARTQATKILGPWHYSLGLDYRVDKVQLGTGVALNDLERRDRPYSIASVIPSVLYDRRDDPFLPTRGWSSLFQPQFSMPILGSDAKFLKLFLQQTQLVNLGAPGVLAGSFRLGAIEPFRTLPISDPELAGLPSRNVFIDERFFAGGSTTHRAYGLDLLGIEGKTLFVPAGQTNDSPVGGNGLLLLNLDYRFPIAGSFGGTAFFDTGNVWADWRDIRLHDLKPGVGVGVRYVSPIGPLRIDIGWKLRRDRGEDAKPVIFLSFGNPF